MLPLEDIPYLPNPSTTSSTWADKRQNVQVFHAADVFWLDIPAPAGSWRDQVLTARNGAQAGSQRSSTGD